MSNAARRPRSGNPVATCAAVSLLVAAVGLAGCSRTEPTAPVPVTAPITGTDAVVIVSGLGTQTPFTTTQDACTSGLSAGNTGSAIRDSLVEAGDQVFTAPAQIGAGQVTATEGVGPSAGCPPALPENLTIDTTGGIDRGGASLAAFLGYLHREYGIVTAHLVGHSMGGLFSRAAIGDIKRLGGPVSVRSLTTLSTPWTGTYPADYAAGSLPLSACGTDATCRQVLTDYKTKLADVEGPHGAANVITTGRLQGKRGWNVSQGDDLAGIPVTLIAGDHYRLPGGRSEVWPNDAIVARDSGLARGIDGEPLQVAACLVRPDVHTISLAEAAGLPWTAAITWDPEVIAAVAASVHSETTRGADTSAC